MLGDWIPLDSEKLNKLRTTKIHGVELNVYLTPYDIPDAVRGTMDREGDWIHIDFKYMGKETPDESLENDGDEEVRFRVGRHSGRLYRISINLEKLRAPNVALNLVTPVKRAIGNLVRNERRKKRSGNYDVAQEVITERQTELEELIPA